MCSMQLSMCSTVHSWDDGFKSAMSSHNRCRRPRFVNEQTELREPVNNQQNQLNSLQKLLTGKTSSNPISSGNVVHRVLSIHTNGDGGSFVFRHDTDVGSRITVAMLFTPLDTALSEALRIEARNRPVRAENRPNVSITNDG